MNFKFFNGKQITESNTELPKREDVEITDIKPEKEKAQVPAILAPGWGNTPANLKLSVEKLANERRVLTVGHSREDHGIIEVEGQKDLNLEEVHKALTLISALEKRGIEKADGVGYSEGGLNLLLAAKLYPEKFRNLVLVNPAGMIGRDDIFSLTKRFLSEMNSSAKDILVKPETRKPIAIFLKEISNYIAKNPLKTYGEVKAISESDILKLLEEAGKNGHGISIIHGVDDKVFPMDKVQQNITSKHISGFYSVKGGHAEIFLHPEKIMSVVDEALDALEKKFNNN